MLSVWCLVPGNYPTARRLRPLRSLIEDRTIAEKSIDLILSRYLVGQTHIDIDIGELCPLQIRDDRCEGGAATLHMNRELRAVEVISASIGICFPV